MEIFFYTLLAGIGLGFSMFMIASGWRSIRRKAVEQREQERALK